MLRKGGKGKRKPMLSPTSSIYGSRKSKRRKEKKGKRGTVGSVFVFH